MKSFSFSADLLDNFRTQILQTRRALIVVHQYPDLDAIGSALALHLALDKQQIEHSIWVAESLNQSFDFLPDLKKITRKLDHSIEYDTVIFLDSSHKSRVCQHQKLDKILNHARSINIDHHSDNSAFAELNLLSDISSVGEMLHILFTQLNWTLDKNIALCLYAAICFDTGRFAYDNTTPQTLEVAASLVSYNLSPNHIYQALYENKTALSFKLLQIALENLVVKEDLGYAYTLIPLSAPKAHFKIVDFIRQLKGIDVFVVIQAVNSNKVKVNLRSKQHFNVSKFAQNFGGGGHIRASGLVIEEKDIESCRDLIIENLEIELKKSKLNDY